ncbi:MAG: tetratricopeptide repeat protein, partial [Endomicrobiales bacterium]
INDLFVKGIDFYDTGNYREAMRYFNAVVIASPQRNDAQELVLDCQAKIREEEERAKAEDLALKQGKIKNEVEAAYNTALQLYDNGDFEEALRAFTRSRDLAQRHEFPKYADNSRNYIISSRTALGERHYRRGFDYFKRNLLDSAAEEYRKVLEFNPDHTSARAELDRLSDELAQRHYEQGMRAFTNGEKEKAKELFRKSLSYKPDKLESLRALERIQ